MNVRNVLKNGYSMLEKLTPIDGSILTGNLFVHCFPSEIVLKNK